MTEIKLMEHEPGYGPPSPVGIWQWEAEFNQVLDLYREVKPKSLLEIGTFHGGTLYHWLQNAQRGAQIVSLDSYAVGVDNRDQYESWRPEGVSLVVLEGDSHEAKTLENVMYYSPFDWLFIDGGHYYNEVKADWEMYSPLVASGGHVIFHDLVTNPDWPWIEVEVFWRELQRQGYLTREIVVDKPEPICGLGIVYL